MKLYEAAEEVTKLLDSYDEETGEYPEEFDQAMSDFQNKGQSIAAYILNLYADIRMVRHELEIREEVAEKMIALISKKEDKVNFLKKYLAENMKRTGIFEINADDKSFKAKLYVERDESVEVFDKSLIHEGFMCFRMTPNRSAIKEALKNGVEVQGAMLVKKDRLEIK